MDRPPAREHVLRVGCAEMRIRWELLTVPRKLFECNLILLWKKEVSSFLTANKNAAEDSAAFLTQEEDYCTD
jgi:hypothetical protein